MKIGEKLFTIIFVAPGMFIILSACLTLFGIPEETTFNIAIPLTFAIIFFSYNKGAKNNEND